MPETLGFWSYVHADDDASFGLISELARDISRAYEAIMNEPIDLFLDRDDLEWGDRWRDRIDQTLSNVAFFVPVLTPRYFASAECRREYKFFLERAGALGIPALVMPVLYEDVPALAGDSADDDLIVTTRESNWRDWRELRFEDRPSGAYRRGVHELATEIARRARVIQATDILPAVEAAVAAGEIIDDDEPGLIDRIAELEVAVPRWGETLTQITDEIRSIGDVMRSATESTAAGNSQGKGFAARLVIARRVAADLEGPVSEIERLVDVWLADLDTIDSGLRTMVDLIGVDASVDAESAATFIHSINTLSTQASEGLGQTTAFVSTLDSLASQSRDMRPVVNRLRSALTAISNGRKVTDQWSELSGH